MHVEYDSNLGPVLHISLVEVSSNYRRQPRASEILHRTIQTYRHISPLADEFVDFKSNRRAQIQTLLKETSETSLDLVDEFFKVTTWVLETQRTHLFLKIFMIIMVIIDSQSFVRASQTLASKKGKMKRKG